MNREKQEGLSSFEKQVHIVGRISSVLVIACYVGVGFAVCRHFGWFPDMGVVISIVIPLFIALFAQIIGEFVGLLPVLGPGGTYITYITGQSLEMKVPALTAVMDNLEVDSNSEKYQVLGIISTVVSSFTVIILLSIFVFFSGLFQPFLQWEPLQPAFQNILPALYPILLIKPLRKDPLICLLTTIITIPVVIYWNPVTNNAAGVFCGMIVASIFAVLFFRRKRRSENN